MSHLVYTVQCVNTCKNVIQIEPKTQFCIVIYVVNNVNLHKMI